jgi:CelD/BcsL family acetyltransferase involved in cellulose biosynthesis
MNVVGSSTTLQQYNPTPAIRTQVRRGGVELIAELADEWRMLCENASCNKPYSQPEYFSSYVKAFEPGGRIVLVTAWREKSLIGILPLVEARERWYGISLRLLTTPRGDHYPWFDLICEAGIGQREVSVAILQELDRLDGWDAIRLTSVTEGSAAYELLRSETGANLRINGFNEAQVPYISIAGSQSDFRSFVGKLSPNFRHMLRKALRKTAKLGELSLRRFDSADPSALQEFYRIEASGWKGKERTAIACHAHLVQFYNEIAIAAAERGYLRLYLAYVGSRAIAGMFAFQLDDKLSVPKLGYDEEYRHLAPGHLLVHEVLKESWESSVKEFDFLGYWMRWKADWTSEFRNSWQIYVYRNNLKGWLLERLRFALRPLARKIYRRIRPAKIAS